jgi:phosphoglycolate phosphatase
MSGSLRLILFDVDGTLVNSQSDILRATAVAFEQVGLPVPDPAATLATVGLSLGRVMPRLAPDQPAPVHRRLEQAYRDAYMTRRVRHGMAASPLYPGALEMLRELADVPENLLGVATGKSARGLDHLIEAHGLGGLFATRQVSDNHPSKPHPSMILTAMAETGVAPEATVMIGDTGFDMAMAGAPRLARVGVSWG